MRRRILCSKQTSQSVILPMDVVFANKNTGELSIAKSGEDVWLNYPSSIYEPIGVVVIPAEHGVLKDGTGTVNQCGVISIVPMNYSTPERGGTLEQGIDWGAYGIDTTGKSDGLGRFDSVTNGLQNYDVVCHVGNNGNPNETIQGTTGYAFLPSDYFTTVKNPYDSGTAYYYNNSNYYIPSPYKNDGSYNPIYGQTSDPSSENNAMSDFKGIVNTKILTDLATGQTDWKTASAITNSSKEGYYPAACCCARFKTTGTKAFVECTNDELKEGKGFWYMPSCGELGYIMPRLKQINQTISEMNSAYGVGVQMYAINYSYFWSSTECSSGHARSVLMYNGRVYDDGRYGYFVRAFMRL